YYIFMIPAFLLMFLTQMYVKSAFKKWSHVPNERKMSGTEAVQRLIRAAGLSHIDTDYGQGQGLRIQQIGGQLSDHYDPRTKTLRLSPAVSQGRSVASLAIAAHELGHAQQDAEEYFPLKLRGAMVPMVNIGSWLGWIMIFGGILLNAANLSWLGVIVFSSGALFALATLPVEFDASARAKRLLTDTGIISTEQEQRGVNSVLNAAALTYVAALVTAVMQILYFSSMIGGRRR
ncbi:MAG: zinc metallopeptidase, partial [Chloroflexota bacterium]